MGEFESDRCQVCLGYYRNPRILPCTHSFCEQPCIQNLLESAEGTTFTCPCCQKEFQIPQEGIETFPCSTDYMQHVISSELEENQELQTDGENDRISIQTSSDANVQGLQHDSRDGRNQRQHDPGDRENGRQHVSGDRENGHQHDSNDRRNRHQHDSDDREYGRQHDPGDRENGHQHDSGDRENGHQHDSNDRRNRRQHDSGDRRNGRQHDLVNRRNRHHHNPSGRGSRRQQVSGERRNERQQNSGNQANGRQHVSADRRNRRQNGTGDRGNEVQLYSINRGNGCQRHSGDHRNGLQHDIGDGENEYQQNLDDRGDRRQHLSQILSPSSLLERQSQEICAICLENYQHPRILPCMHNFSEDPCLINLIQRAEGTTFSCPLCRLEIPVPPNGESEFPFNTNFRRVVPGQERFTLQLDRQNVTELNGRNLAQTGEPASQVSHVDLSSERQSREICAICLENCQNPRILPCMHNFCEDPCLTDLLHSAEGITFNCPLCRQEFPVPSNGVSTFPYNTNFRRVAPGQERLASQRNRHYTSDSNRNSLAQAREPEVSHVGLSSERCPICLEDLRNPRTLPCGHKLCETCLHNQHQSAETGIFRCPLCRVIFYSSTTGIRPFNNRSSLHVPIRPSDETRAVPETEEHLSPGTLVNLFSERSFTYNTNLRHSPSRQSGEAQRLPAVEPSHILSIPSSTLTPERLTVAQLLRSYVRDCCTVSGSICSAIFYIIALGAILGQIGFATFIFFSSGKFPVALGAYVLARCILDIIMILSMCSAKQKAFNVSFYIHIFWSLAEVIFVSVGCHLFFCYYDLVFFGCFLAYLACLYCIADRD